MQQKSRVYPPLLRSNYFQNESTLFNKNSFGGLGADTLNFCESTPFSGQVGEGGAVGFFKGWNQVPDFLCVAASVCYEKFVLWLCNKKVGSTLLFYVVTISKMSRLFLTVFMNTVLKDRGQIHWIFASRLPFLGRWGRGGGCRLFQRLKSGSRFSFVLPPVYAMENLYSDCATKK